MSHRRRFSSPVKKGRGSKVVKVVRKRIIKVKQANIVRASSS